MKSTGIVRNVDELGRIVIPKELRTTMDMTVGSGVEIFVEGDKIIIMRYYPGCHFCTNADNLVDFGGKKICKDCIAEIAKKQ